MSVITPFRGRPLAVAALATALALGATACQDNEDAKGAKEPKGPKDSQSSSGSPGSPGSGTAASASPESADAEAFPGKTGSEIATLAIETTKKATSLTVETDIKLAEGPLRGRIAMSTRGDCVGTMSPGSSGSFEILRIGKTAYMRPDEAFLRDQVKGEPKADRDAAVALMKGRWMKANPSDPDAKGMLELCDLNVVLREVVVDRKTAIRRAGETTVGGRKALKLVETDGTSTESLYVATEGKPYILKIEAQDDQEPGTVTFSAFDEPVQAKEPAPSEILDLDKLGAS
ncbi:hypothetical protein [Streptomyces sp. NPDC004726]